MPRLRPEILDARRQAILDGARRAFARHGFEGATVRVLETETGASRGAIFHHFADKDALFLALAEEDAAEMSEVVAAHGLVHVMRELPARDPGWLGVALEVSRRLRTDAAFRDRWSQHLDRIRDATVERIERQQAAGIVRSDVAAERLAAYLQLVYDGLLVQLATGLSRKDTDALLDLVEAGVRQDSLTAPKEST
jgi:AcrR family transcriptional regulator